MSMMTATADSLSRDTGLEVTDIHVLIAKNSIAGLDSTSIAEVLGVAVNDVTEIQNEEAYKAARLLLATDYSRSMLAKDFGWDDIESTALQSLAKRVHLERDTETLLRIAATANRAQRRMAVGNKDVLDPAAGGTRVALSLTQRIVERLSQTGERTRTEERQISVIDGSAKNPTFDDIDSLLGVSRKPAIAANMRIQTRDADFDVDDLHYPQ